MIFGNITQEKTYAFLPEDLKECFAYAKEHDLASYEKGSHAIDGERLFVNVVEYETTRSLPCRRRQRHESRNSHPLCIGLSGDPGNTACRTAQTIPAGFPSESSTVQDCPH